MTKYRIPIQKYGKDNKAVAFANVVVHTKMPIAKVKKAIEELFSEGSAPSLSQEKTQTIRRGAKRKLIPKKVKVMAYPYDEKAKPLRVKMIELEDMHKMGIELSRKQLRKYGFTDMNVNWLEDNGYI